MSEEIKRIIWRREYRHAPYETRYLRNGKHFEIACPARYATLEDAIVQRNSIFPYEYFDDLKDFDPII